jgi:ribosomal protein S12 methylthiotransferase accessory factor
MEEAKVSALSEVFERDSESMGFYDPSRCFRLEGGFARLSALLGSYWEKGVDVIFQDITSAMGIPAYKCFVIAPDGEIVKGCGAHLDGKRAIISALTETPWPYPYSPLSAKGPEKLPVIRFEDLPDYATGNPSTDLQMLEKLLTANNHPPVYADLRRKDLEIPVVRAIVPGMETSSERDRHSRVSLRQFAAYLRLHNKRKFAFPTA